MISDDLRNDEKSDQKEKETERGVGRDKRDDPSDARGNIFFADRESCEQLALKKLEKGVDNVSKHKRVNDRRDRREEIRKPGVQGADVDDDADAR